MTSQTRRPATLIATAVVVALLIAGAFGLWYLFLRPAEPAAVEFDGHPAPVPPGRRVRGTAGRRDRRDVEGRHVDRVARCG